jgi:hypothetical protein
MKNDMKFIIQVLVTAAMCFLLQTFLPWWSMAIGSFVVAYFIGNKGFVSFSAGLIGVSLLWVGVALYIDVSTHSILTEKINKLLPLNAFLLTGLVGGLVGGFAALSGSLLKSK